MTKNTINGKEFINTQAQSHEEVTMANNITIEMMEKVATKVAEMEALVEKKSSNKNPDYYKTLKECNLWKLVGQAMKGDIDPVFLNKLLETKGGNKVEIEVYEGDNIFKLMDKYDKLKNVYQRVMKAAEEYGLKLVGDTFKKA